MMEILKLAREGGDIYSKVAEKCLGGPCSPEERLLTKIVFWSLLRGETREETEERVRSDFPEADEGLVLSRRQALQRLYPELGKVEVLTKFVLVLELQDLKSELDGRIAEICGAW